MIVPVASETEWTSVWTAAPTWQPPDKPLLVIVPHPDDETLGIGGFIAMQVAQSRSVQVVAVTDGENAYTTGTNLEIVRRAEQMAALKRLGVNAGDVARLQLTDSEVTSPENALVELLLPFVTSDTHILAPWTGDFHPDHEACGRAASQIAERRGSTLTFYFFWTWHRGTPALLRDLPLRSLTVPPDQMRAKEEALSNHLSQLDHPSGEPILPDYLLWPARRPSEIFLPA
jgi:LmbE family N-acetylglucosaminyl deacetylase